MANFLFLLCYCYYYSSSDLHVVRFPSSLPSLVLDRSTLSTLSPWTVFPPQNQITQCFCSFYFLPFNSTSYLFTLSRNLQFSQYPFLYFLLLIPPSAPPSQAPLGGSFPTQSHLTPLATSDYTTARFHGHLDIQTLGGAGFASQRTTASWDFSSFDGIDLVLEDGDDKVYTFILKDEIAQELPYVGDFGGTRREGEGEGTREGEGEREQATVSWECDFKVPESTDSAPEGFGEEEEKNRRKMNMGKEKDNGKVVSIPWKSFKPTYRGKEKKDAKPIDLASIQRMSLMMRRYETYSLPFSFSPLHPTFNPRPMASPRAVYYPIPPLQSSRVL
jgi:Complex I intermediate-associated protein 30 (CIA30)